MTESIKIVEVGPRDGLQNEPSVLDVATRVGFIEALVGCGLVAVEAGSFVSPKWVPQMADSGAVLTQIHRQPGVNYPVLTPNLRGFESAVAAGAEEVALFAAASETFSQKNINCSIAQSVERFEPLVATAQRQGVAVRGYISCVLGCPYEGAVDSGRVAELAALLQEMGCYEISLGDTIGVGTPAVARQLVRRVAETVPVEYLAAHFHDTYGQAIANIYAVLEEGITVVDSAVAGLGGCPYAQGASGNVATEDLVYLLNGLGLEHGIDLDALVGVGRDICMRLGRKPASRVNQAWKSPASA